MFSNLNTSTTQQQGFALQSPMGMKPGQTSSSIFQTPTQNTFNMQQNTPSFLQTPTTTTSLFGGTTNFNTSFSSPSAGLVPNQQMTSPFVNKPLGSGFGTQNVQTSIFSQSGQPNSFTSAFAKSEPSSSTAIPLGFGSSTTFGSQQPQQTFGSSTFGSQPTATSQPFGGFTTTQSSVQFGAQQPSMFGSTQPQPTQQGSGQFGFGQSTLVGGFGTSQQQQQQQPASGFGTSLGTQTSTFGNSLFGAPKTTATSIPSLGFGSQQFGTTPFSSTAQPSFGSGFSTSFGSTQPTSTIQTSFTGQTNQPQGFANPQQNIFGQPPSTGIGTQPFGQTSTSFNQPFGISQPTSSTFGQPSFGSSNLWSSQPVSQPSSNINLSSASTFSSFGQPRAGSIFDTKPTTTFPSFSNQTTTTSLPFGGGFGSQITSQPSSFVGGGFSVGGGSTTTNQAQSAFPSTPNVFGNTSAPTSVPLQPVSQTVVFPGLTSMSSVINTEQDKTIEVFGYKSAATRFGPLEYFNTNYDTTPDFKTVTDTSLNMCGTTGAQEIDSYSYNSYDFDIKLGSVLNANNDFELREIPTDTVTKLRYSRFHSDLLAGSSWDGTVSVWKIDDKFIQNGNCRVIIPGCAFDIDWFSSGTSLVLASSTGSIHTLDIINQATIEIAKHSGPAKTVRACGDYNNNMIISGSYDGTVKLWDTRSRVCCSTVHAGGKVFGLDICKSGFSFITSEREVLIYKYTDVSRPLIRRKIEASPFPLRCVAMTTFNCRKEGGFVVAIGTCGGKVSVVAQSNNAKDFTFKVNRVSHPNRMNAQYAFPVHDLAFHPRTYVLGLAGGDGSVSLWDIQKHTQVHMMNRSSLPVTALSFNSDGRVLAYSVGYDWSRGIRAYKYRNMKPAIYLRRCNEELKCSLPDPIHL